MAHPIDEWAELRNGNMGVAVVLAAVIVAPIILSDK